MDYDLCIIGGGINGAGIARDAAGRGLNVLLLEAGDLGCATSSASSKMIHGGLRYLEFYEFGLVRKSLAEREVMLHIAPQIVKPLRLCIPQTAQSRPAWMVRLGLFIYDHLWLKQTLPKSEAINLATHKFGMPLINQNVAGFAYSDCWVDDARLVVLNAMDAHRRGADILTYTPCTGLRPEGGVWHVNTPNGEYRARSIINATGPYAQKFLGQMGLMTPSTPHLRLVQGSHIIVPQLYQGDHAYLLQQPDGRVVFTFPYEGHYTLIGTTETPVDGDIANVAITPAETDYLLGAANLYFSRKLKQSDVMRSFCGVRPLFDDAEADARKVTRDYRFFRQEIDGAPMLSVFGGKLTTYRVLAGEALAHLSDKLDMPSAGWTHESPLPTCPIDVANYPSQIDEDLIKYFIEIEFAKTVDDILWRRTKWGMHLSPQDLADFYKAFHEVTGK